MFKTIVVIFAVLSIVVSDSSRDGRILGGSTVNQGIVQSMVSIRSHGATGIDAHFAGGVLIHELYVLTGAFYMAGRDDDSLDLAMGMVDLVQTPPRVVRSAEIVRHAAFDINTRQNDLAIIRMACRVPLTMHIVPTIINQRIMPVGTDAHVSGWGATEADKGGNSQFLRRLSVRTQACLLTPSGNHRPDEHLNICARSALINTGFCTSDVGGPLISIDGLIGIASWHRTPCGANQDVYVRISTFANWINSVITRNLPTTPPACT